MCGEKEKKKRAQTEIGEGGGGGRLCSEAFEYMMSKKH